MSAKIITFGEVMLRLTPPGYERLVQTNTLEMSFGGAESNVAASLAQYGMEAAYVTKLPNNLIGDAAVNEIRRYGVDTRYIIREDGRMGVYFIEKGASVRSSEVVYDRANSVISQVKPGEINWNEIFKDAKWFHFTGITPALGDNVAEVTEEACKAAKEMGVTISCDINYRSKLWDPKRAGKVMKNLMRYVDVCITNEEHAALLFGIKSPVESTNDDGLDFNEEGSKLVAKQLASEFGFKLTAVTFRRTVSASHNKWWAMLYDNRDFYLSRKYDLQIVDRVGSGDAFAAGFIYGMVNNRDAKYAVEFGAAACALKHTIEGDINYVRASEVEGFMNASTPGAVKR